MYWLLTSPGRVKTPPFSFPERVKGRAGAEKAAPCSMSWVSSSSKGRSGSRPSPEKRASLPKAAATGSKFLTGYVQTLIDSANLRAVVRTVRMGKDSAFMHAALVPGGSIDCEALVRSSDSGDAVAAAFNATPLEAAAALGAQAMKGGAMTDFELACDNAVSAYLTAAKMIPFGCEPAAEYLALLECEITCARMILTGRLSGIEPEVIRERLRDINA